MTKEQQRIKIAEACGWIWQVAKEGTAAHWFNQNTKEWAGELPNYPEDLNACHEMERGLSKEKAWKYCCELESICGGGCDPEFCTPEWESVHASAAQRCEAFLRTLGLWVEDEKGNQ